MAVRFKIQFLTETTRENSVCHTKFSDADDLALARRHATDFAPRAKAEFHATGYQIRDLQESGRIVALENFDA